MPDSAAILRRFVQAKLVLSDDRFRPPKWMVEGVDSGEMEAEVLNTWKYVVTSLGTHFDYGAGVKYWRNKCLKMGYSIPQKYLTGGGGEGGTGPWRVKSGDEIEEWVKQQLKSKKLLVELGNSEHDWLLEINHLERLVSDAQDRVDKHLGAMLGGKMDSRRQKWLGDAQKELVKEGGKLVTARESLEKLQKTAQRYDTHRCPTIEFEREVQFALLLASKDFDKRTILDALAKAVKRFEEGLDIPDATPSDDPSKYEGYKQAGVLDWMANALRKAWDFLTNAFDAFTDWVAGISKIEGRLSAVLTMGQAEP